MNDPEQPNQGTVAGGVATVATLATDPAQVTAQDPAATAATAATDDENHLFDAAQDTALGTLDSVHPGTDHFTADDVDEAIRIRLLAAAYLAHPLDLIGKALPVSTMLLHSMRETLDAYAEPMTGEGDRPSLASQQHARLRAAALAGIRGDDAPPVLSPTMTREAAEIARQWLTAFRPPAKQEAPADAG